jgi:protein-S-isoprenylcysteine O-methyltransferase Ste14
MPKIYIIVWIVSALWIISEIVLARFTHSSKREDITSQEQTSLRRLWLVIIPCVIVGSFWSVQSVGLIRLGRFYVMYSGLMLIIFGLMIRWRAIYALRKYFTVDVSIVKDHKLIDTGEYEYVRHPAYSGSLLSFFGLGWALGNWVSFVIIFFPILWAFIRRINLEEKTLLSSSLGEEYQNYMKTTKRLIPKIY